MLALETNNMLFSNVITPNVIAITRIDGGVSIMYVTPEHIDEAIRKFSELHAGTRFEYVSHAELREEVADRYFREAWVCAGNKIQVDMPKARGIHMDNIRTVRDAELTKLDREQITAISISDTAAMAAIENKKQALRDLPVTFDLTVAKTADELRKLWPPNLPKAEE